MLVFLIIFSTNAIIHAQIVCNPNNRVVLDSEKRILLDRHNMYRNQIALGTNTIGPKLPYATNMYQLYWNEDLAARAQQWANGCLYQHSTSTFRAQPPTYPYVGENLFLSGSSIQKTTIDFGYPVDAWQNEITKMTTTDIASISSYVFNSATGHFTQQIWATTNQLGCGVSQYYNAGWYYTYIVCHYATGGNIVSTPTGTPLYNQASAITCGCPAGYTCGNLKYTGLCCQSGYCDSLYSSQYVALLQMSLGTTKFITQSFLQVE
jgi:hypothetical protein